MNKYLLLRDNKQSGPFTLEELVTKGFKAYDLVWLEGKSAAWRYPSEFAELKPHAPVVEEQPYDRFYKKPTEQKSSTEFLEARKQKEIQLSNHVVTTVATETITTPVSTTTTTVPATIIEEVPVVKPVTVNPAKKIYVTMPAANGYVAATAAVKAIKTEEVTQAVLQTSTAAVLKEAYNPYEPVPVEEKVKQEKVSKPVTVKETIETTPPAFSQRVENSFYKQEAEHVTTVTSTRYRKDSRKLVMRSLIAACLILGGVVIGLGISYTKQQSDSRQLDKLVKQINEREKNNTRAVKKETAAPVNTTPLQPVSNPEENNIDENTASMPVSDVAANTTSNAKKDKSAVKKAGTPPENNTGIPVSDIQDDMEVTPAVMSDTKRKNINYQEAVIESARKNIYALVDVASNKYKIGVLGGVSELYLTLSNNSLYPLDQVAVEVKYFGPEKKVVKTQTLLFNDIAPGEQKTLEVPRTNRGVSIDYSITQINSKVLGLAKARF